MTNEEDVEKKKGSMIFSLVSYVSINCIRFTGMISAQSTPTNNEIQSIYFVGKGQGDCNIDTQPHGGGCNFSSGFTPAFKRFQHTATRRWLPPYPTDNTTFLNVSTHSHPKVAAGSKRDQLQQRICFNTQPPEGGCGCSRRFTTNTGMFQHTATRRWLRG